jgi:MFS family permease
MSAAVLDTERTETLALIPAFIVVAADATGLGIILPLLPFYAQKLGATPFVFGSLVSIYALCQLVAGPILGLLSDKYGRKRVLIASQTGTFLGLVLLASSSSLILVFLSRIIDGLTSGNISVAHAYAAEHSSASDRKLALGATSGAIGTGLFIGPAISGLLVQFGTTAPIWVAALLSLISIAASLLLLPAEHLTSAIAFDTEKFMKLNAFPDILSSARTWRVLGLLALFFFAFSMFMSQAAFFLSARFTWQGHPFGTRELGAVFAYAGLMNFFVQMILMRHASQWTSDKTIVLSSFALMAIGFLGLSASSKVELLALFLTLDFVGSAFLRPTLVAELSRSVPLSRLGTIMGLNQSLMSIANIVAPLVGGALIGRGWYTSWAMLAAVLAACGAMATIGLVRGADEG